MINEVMKMNKKLYILGATSPILGYLDKNSGVNLCLKYAPKEIV